jgi:hypothetical protein
LPEPLKFNFPLDTSRLTRAIDTADDIGAVIRIHFEIDRALEHIITAMIPNASALRHRYMGQRIAFLRALGLHEVRLLPVTIINEIRNKFAHHEKEGVSASDIARLHDSITALFGKEIPTHFGLLHKKSDTVREWVYGEMTLKEKFCFLGYFALAGIAAIENEYEKIRFNKIRNTPW